jgi:hypothetical protein
MSLRTRRNVDSILLKMLMRAWPGYTPTAWKCYLHKFTPRFSYELVREKLCFFFTNRREADPVFLMNWQEMNVGFYGSTGDKFRFSYELSGDERNFL